MAFCFHMMWHQSLWSRDNALDHRALGQWFASGLGCLSSLTIHSSMTTWSNLAQLMCTKYDHIHFCINVRILRYNSLFIYNSIIIMCVEDVYVDIVYIFQYFVILCICIFLYSESHLSEFYLLVIK